MINLNIFSTPCNISDSFSSESNCAAFALSAYEKLNIELIIITICAWPETKRSIISIYLVNYSPPQSLHLALSRATQWNPFETFLWPRLEHAAHLLIIHRDDKMVSNTHPPRKDNKNYVINLRTHLCEITRSSRASERTFTCTLYTHRYSRAIGARSRSGSLFRGWARLHNWTMQSFPLLAS